MPQLEVKVDFGAQTPLNFYLILDTTHSALSLDMNMEANFSVAVQVFSNKN